MSLLVTPKSGVMQRKGPMLYLLPNACKHADAAYSWLFAVVYECCRFILDEGHNTVLCSLCTAALHAHAFDLMMFTAWHEPLLS